MGNIPETVAIELPNVIRTSRRSALEIEDNKLLFECYIRSEAEKRGNIRLIGK